MAGSKTFEAWKKYEFMLEGQVTIHSPKNPLPIPPSIKSTEITKLELRKIRQEQKKIAEVYINTFLIRAKKSFRETFKRSKNKVKLLELASQEVDNVLQSELYKEHKRVIITTLDIDLPAATVKQVQEYYYHNYIVGKKVHYDFISPEHPGQLANKRSIPLLCQALFEMKQWLENFNVSKILELEEKRKEKGSFQVALYFADGTIYKILEKDDNTTKCAQKLNVKNSRSYISESIKPDSTSRKSIFNLPSLIKDSVEYCDFHGIILDSRFIAACMKKKVYPK